MLASVTAFAPAAMRLEEIREFLDGRRVLAVGDVDDLAARAMSTNRLMGIVTLATFTCQPREAVIGRRQENQWLGELQRGTRPLQNPLFLANVTMPTVQRY